MRIVGVGDLVLDYYYKNGKLLGVNGGSTSHNIIFNLVSLGLKGAVVGACGNDSMGRISMLSLKEIGVDINDIIISNDISTRCFHINLSKDGFFSKKSCPICGEKRYYLENNISKNKILEKISEEDILVLDNLSEINQFIFKETNNKIFIDLGYYYELENYSDEQIKDIFKRYFEIINLNENVFRYLKKRFKTVNFLNAGLIVVTKGKKGADFIYQGKLIRKKLNAIREIDSNGAGDAFFSAIIYKYLKGNFDINESYEFAIKMASRVVKTIGARCSLYKIKKVKNNCTCSNFEIRKKPNRCSLNITHLEARILNALKTNAFEKLSSINLTDLNTALFVGTGGSYAGALFASKIINKKYNTITLAKQPREVLYQNNLNIEKVFLFSYSGTTNDLLVGTKNIENDKKIIITKGELKKVIEKTKLKETQIISYYANFNKGKERGYLSFEGTIVPAALFFKLYYKNAKEFIEDSISYWKSYFDNYFKNFKNIFKSTKTINIFYGDNVSCAAFDLESKFIESGVFNVIMHEKKNFSHGRFINYEQLSDKVNIYLRSKHVSKYEKELLHYLKNDNNIIIESKYDNIFCEFDMLIMTQYFIYYLSKVLKIDMSKPSYSEEAMKIYFYKGEL